MKKLLPLIVGILLTIPSFSQGFYIGVNAGYGFPVAGGTLSNFSSNGSFTVKSFSLGEGINAGISGGRMFSKNFGAELGISYLLGNTIYTSSTNLSEISGQMLRFTPSIRFIAGDRKIKPFCVIGGIIGIPLNVSSGNTNSIDTFSGNLSYGFHGSTGIMIMFDEYTSMFISVAGNYQNWFPAKSRDNNGNVMNYVKSGNINTLPPNETPGGFIPFSSAGFNVELIYTFKQKAKKAQK